MRSWLEGDAIFLKIKTCNSIPVRELPPPQAPPRSPARPRYPDPSPKFSLNLSFSFRVMRRANVELHVTLKKARKEVKSTRSQLGEVVAKQEEKSKLALERLKVTIFLY